MAGGDSNRNMRGLIMCCGFIIYCVSTCIQANAADVSRNGLAMAFVSGMLASRGASVFKRESPSAITQTGSNEVIIQTPQPQAPTLTHQEHAFSRPHLGTVLPSSVPPPTTPYPRNEIRQTSQQEVRTSHQTEQNTRKSPGEIKKFKKRMGPMDYEGMEWDDYGGRFGHLFGASGHIPTFTQWGQHSVMIDDWTNTPVALKFNPGWYGKVDVDDSHMMSFMKKMSSGEPMDVQYLTIDTPPMNNHIDNQETKGQRDLEPAASVTSQQFEKPATKAPDVSTGASDVVPSIDTHEPPSGKQIIDFHHVISHDVPEKTFLNTNSAQHSHHDRQRGILNPALLSYLIRPTPSPALQPPPIQNYLSTLAKPAQFVASNIFRPNRVQSGLPPNNLVVLAEFSRPSTTVSQGSFNPGTLSQGQSQPAPRPQANSSPWKSLLSSLGIKRQKPQPVQLHKQFHVSHYENQRGQPMYHHHQHSWSQPHPPHIPPHESSFPHLAVPAPQPVVSSPHPVVPAPHYRDPHGFAHNTHFVPNSPHQLLQGPIVHPVHPQTIHSSPKALSIGQHQNSLQLAQRKYPVKVTIIQPPPTRKPLHFDNGTSPSNLKPVKHPSPNRSTVLPNGMTPREA